MIILKKEHEMYSIGGSNVTSAAIAKLFDSVDQFNTFNAFINSTDEGTAEKMAEVLKGIHLEFDHSAILTSFEGNPVAPETYAELVLDKYYPDKLEKEYGRLLSDISRAQYKPLDKEINRLIEENKTAEEFVSAIKLLLDGRTENPFNWDAQAFCRALEHQRKKIVENPFFKKGFNNEDLTRLAKAKTIGFIFRVYDFEEKLKAPVPEEMVAKIERMRQDMTTYGVDWYSIEYGFGYDDDNVTAYPVVTSPYQITVLKNGVNRISL